MPQYRNLKGKNISELINDEIFVPSNAGVNIYTVYPDVQINDCEKEIVNNAAVVVVDNNGVILWEIAPLNEWRNKNAGFEIYKSAIMNAVVTLPGHPYNGKKISEVLQITLESKKTEAEAIANSFGFNSPE